MSSSPRAAARRSSAAEEDEEDEEEGAEGADVLAANLTRRGDGRAARVASLSAPEEGEGDDMVGDGRSEREMGFEVGKSIRGGFANYDLALGVNTHSLLPRVLVAASNATARDSRGW